MATHKVPERRGKAGQEPPRGPLLSGQESLSRYTPIGQELGTCFLLVKSWVLNSYWSKAPTWSPSQWERESA